MKKNKKMIRVEGLTPMTVAEYNLCKVLSVVMFPFYAAAYGVAHLFKMKSCEDMETFGEWFCLFNKNVVFIED